MWITIFKIIEDNICFNDKRYYLAFNNEINVIQFSISSLFNSLKKSLAMKIKFPSGKIGYELCYYMGMEDPKGHLLERPQIVQDMYNNDKCRPGMVADYTPEEIAQLSSELVNALDIKADHIDNDKGSTWTSLNQHQLQQFANKINSLK